MQANPQNLARWIDELAASVERIEKRLNTPMPYTPYEYSISNGVGFLDEVISSEPLILDPDIDLNATVVTLSFDVIINNLKQTIAYVSGSPAIFFDSNHRVTYGDNIILVKPEYEGIKLYLNIVQVSGNDTITASLTYSYLVKSQIEGKSLMQKVSDKIKSITKGGK